MNHLITIVNTAGLCYFLWDATDPRNSRIRKAACHFGSLVTASVLLLQLVLETVK